MQFKLQHADSQADDPHDVIAAQLRDLAPRLATDPDGPALTPAVPAEPSSEPSLRAAPLNDNTGDVHDLTPRARSGRGIMLLIACAGIAAVAAWHSYGDEAKQGLSSLLPQLLAGTSAPAQNANAAEPQDAASQIATPQPAGDPAPVQEAAGAASATPTEPAAAAPSTAQPPPTQAAIPPELAQSIETMAREIVSLKQTVEHLQAGQQQLSRDVAKAAEHEARRKPAVQASKPAAPRPQRASTPAPAPRAFAPSSQAYPQGQTYPQGAAQRDAYIPPTPAPTQLPPQPGDTSVPRPPMPLR